MTQPYSDDERVAALHRLIANDGNVSLTSRELGISRMTLIGWRDRTIPLAEERVSSAALDRLDREEAEAAHDLDLATRVVRESALIAFGHLRDIASWDQDGKLTFVPSVDLAEGASAGIQSIEFETKDDMVGEGAGATVIRTTKIKVKRESKLGALSLLAKIAGLITTGPQVVVDNSQNINVEGLTLDELRAIAGSAQ